jgi:hypothetical protein
LGLFDAFLGRTRLRKPQLDHIFALATAAPSLEAAELQPGSAGGVCLQAVEGGAYADVDRELRQLVQLAAASPDFHARADIARDDLGFTWVLFRDAPVDDQVNLAHVAATTLQGSGYGEQLLAAVFRVKRTDLADAPGYLVYNYKRGNFYPFMPTAGRNRDNAAEFRTAGALARLMPMEQDVSRWFPLWDCPV